MSKSSGLARLQLTPQGGSGEESPPPLVASGVDFSEQALEKMARRLLSEAGCAPLARTVRVNWNRRLRTTAGLAYAGKGLVMLNPRLVIFGMEEVERTLRHELAHLLARYRMGRRRIAPHGPEWQQACADLGLAGEKRCHELPLPRREVARKHRYRCRHCGVEVLRVRPFSRAVACLPCCRAHNHGHYHEKYRLLKVPL